MGELPNNQTSLSLVLRANRARGVEVGAPRHHRPNRWPPPDPATRGSAPLVPSTAPVAARIDPLIRRAWIRAHAWRVRR